MVTSTAKPASATRERAAKAERQNRDEPSKRLKERKDMPGSKRPLSSIALDTLVNPLGPTGGVGYMDLLRNAYSRAKESPLLQLAADPLSSQGLEELLRSRYEQEALLNLRSDDQPLQVRQAAIEGRMPRRVATMASQVERKK